MESAVRWAWDRQSVWSQAADRVKRSIERYRAAGLILGIIGACAATAATQLMAWSSGTGKALALLSAIAVGFIPLTTKYAGPQNIQEWTRLRSVSERLKSEVYMALAGVGAYRDGDASAELLDRVGRSADEAADLLPRTIGITPLARSLPEVSDVDSYIGTRVAGQIEGYYRPRAAQVHRRIRRIRRCELTLTAIAVVLGAISVVFAAGWASAWVATVTTVTAAVAAHVASTRYAYQELEFSRAAAELEAITIGHRSGVPDADDALVEQCEQVISAQNEGWIAKWLAE